MKNSLLAKSIALALCVTALTAQLQAPMVLAATEQAVETQEEQTEVSQLAEPAVDEQQVSNIPRGNAYIPKGTTIEVELTDNITSKTAHVGDLIPLRTVNNLIINDVVVVPAGAEVTGVVTKARKSGGLGRGGKLEFVVTSVKARNSVEIPLEYKAGKHGGGDGGAVAVFTAVSIVGGLFMKGKNVTYNKGLKFDTIVTADTDLKTSLDKLSEAMNNNYPHGVTITEK